MKRLIYVVFCFWSICVYGQVRKYNCRVDFFPKAETVDLMERIIEKKGNTIIIPNYFDDKPLILDIIKIDTTKKTVIYEREDNPPWYYCECGQQKYILIGLETKRIDLYTIMSEVEVFKETFDTL